MNRNFKVPNGKPRCYQRGFLLSWVFIGVLAALSYFVIEWMEVQSRKAEAEKFDSIVQGQMYVIDGLEQYFELACNQNGVVPTTTINDLIANGYVDSAIMYNPHSYTYTVTIVRPNVSFDANTNKAIAQGRTKLSLSATVPDIRERTQIIQRYRDYEVEYQATGNVVTVTRLYNQQEGDELESFLNDGITVGGGGTTYICI